ncbi:MAG: ATP-binding cassette domain-containing protein [Oribacterium sp.]|nr:ATP-binding cassette domain-containing protein [Oribacterium sp.]
MLIQFRDITKIYDGKKILNRVNLSIDTASDSKDVLLKGPSGIGKTTLLRIMAGIENSDSGSIEITMGEAAGGGKKLRIGMVFQENRLLEQFSAVENVTCVDSMISRTRAVEELKKVLEEEALDKPVRELSGGMQRRVAIVRAMLPASDLLIMDEPLTGLDPETRDRVIRYIMENKGRRPLIMASHDTEGLPRMRELALV